MREHTVKSWFIGGCLVLLISGCAAGEQTKAPSDPPKVYRGWYMEHAGQGRLQACGQSQPWRITQAADLPARAQRFGLEPDTPVYVQVSGVLRNDDIAITSVEQFGSSTPVRNCAMTGVVIPEH